MKSIFFILSDFGYFLGIIPLESLMIRNECGLIHFILTPKILFEA